jgi:hypothetical protein
MRWRKAGADQMGSLCRIHTTGRVTPAMQADISDTMRDIEWLAGMMDAVATRAQPPGRQRQATGNTEVLNTTVTVAMADAREPRR